MFRRKLAIYTLMYSAGITAGYFLSDKNRAAAAACFSAAAVAAAVAATYKDAPDLCLKRSMILTAVFAAGFVLFVSRSLAYSGAASAFEGRDVFTGTVTEASVNEGTLRLIARSDDPAGERILISLRNYESYLKTQEGCPDEDHIYELAGAEIEAKGEYGQIRTSDDPGCFDYRLYMRSRSVALRFDAFVITVADEESVPFITRVKRYLYGKREAFLTRFGDEETRGFIRGVIFGDKSDIDEDVLKEFNENSTGHILAVSGLHIGFLYGMLRALTKRRRTFAVSFFIILVILIYGEMTMWSPATVRACIVMAVSLLSVHLKRRSDLLTSVSLSAFIILTSEPYQLFNAGFQMSFLAMAGIAFFTKPVSSVTGEALAVMLAVQAGTLPVMVYTYSSIDPLSVLINIPVILLASVLVPLCISMLVLEAACGFVPSIGIRLADLISYALVNINHILNFGGIFAIKTAGYGAALIITVYGMLFLLTSEWSRTMILRKRYKDIARAVLLVMLPALMLSSCLYDTFADDEIVFVAVGQGDCTHIRADGQNVLIDGGGDAGYGEKEGYNVGEKILMPYLLHSGAFRTEAALVTHLHADHYKGIQELAEIYPVGILGIPADYRGNSSMSIDAEGVMYIMPGTRLTMDEDVFIEAIWPAELSDEPIEADDPNEHNTVYMIHYRGIRVMVTGDLLEEDEKEMVSYYEGTDTLKCDILKVAHHGSKSSSCEVFLDAASPSVAVIQCGRNNLYGHPHQQTLDRLEKRNITTLRTDINGAVGIDIRRKGIRIDLFHEDIDAS